MTRYHHSRDPITDRIITEFADFDGWADEPPAAVVVVDEFTSADTTLGASRAARSQEHGSTGRLGGLPSVSSASPGESLVVCPSCGCVLPETNHLISNAMLGSGELSRARDKGAA